MYLWRIILKQITICHILIKDKGLYRSQMQRYANQVKPFEIYLKFIFFGKIVEPGVIDGTKIATSSNARDLPGEINDEKLDDKETSRNSDAPNEENSKQKSIIDAEEVQKSREKRGVLSTFISRKKFYNLLRNKLDGCV